MGVTAEQLAQAAPISEIIPSRKQAIAAMRFSDELCVINFLSVYDRLPEGDRERVPLEAVGIKAGVNLNELLGAVIVSFKTMQAQKSGLLAISKHPEVLQKTIDYAQLPGGNQDRRMLHEAVGFIPTPKGMNIALNLMTPNPPPPPKRESDDSEPDVNDVFPVITHGQEQWQENKQRLLAEKN